MAKAKKKSARNGAAAAAGNVGLQLPLVIESSSDTPTQYMNYAEIHHTPHEFGIAFARVVGKMPTEKLEEAKQAGRVTVPADLLLMLPPTMIPGLIDALTKQRAAYEMTYGPIVDGGKKP